MARSGLTSYTGPHTGSKEGGISRSCRLCHCPGQCHQRALQHFLHNTHTMPCCFFFHLWPRTRTFISTAGRRCSRSEGYTSRRFSRRSDSASTSSSVICNEIHLANMSGICLSEIRANPFEHFACGPRLISKCSKAKQSLTEGGRLLGLTRTVYLHRIWPYVWWFPCLKYRMYTVYTYVCMVLANSKNYSCFVGSIRSVLLRT